MSCSESEYKLLPLFKKVKMSKDKEESIKSFRVMYILVFEEKLLPYKNAAAGKVYHGKFVMRKVCQSVAFYTSQHLQMFRLQNPFLVCFVCSLGLGAMLAAKLNCWLKSLLMKPCHKSMTRTWIYL